MPTFNRVYESQPTVLEILTQQCRYKRAEINLLADEKGRQLWIQVVILIIHISILIHLFMWYLLHGKGLEFLKIVVLFYNEVNLDSA